MSIAADCPKRASAQRHGTLHRRMTLFRERPDLLPSFRAGDRETLEIVYRAYVDVVTRVVRRATASVKGAREVWPDLVQDCFIRAFAPRARADYDGLRDYQPYLLTLCRHLMIDWARKS